MRMITIAALAALSLNAHSIEYVPDTDVAFDIIHMHDTTTWERVCQSYDGVCDVPEGTYQVKLLDRNWKELDRLRDVRVQHSSPELGLAAQLIALSLRIDDLEAAAEGPEVRHMFLSSETYAGDLGGMSGADAKCQALADASRGVHPGVYKAWLSDDNESPSTRLEQSPVPYVRPDNHLIAHDWEDLTDGRLVSPISVDEQGTPVHRYEVTPLGHTLYDEPRIPLLVWTNTDWRGNVSPGIGAVPTKAHCENWTVRDSSAAILGTAGEYNARWTGEWDTNSPASSDFVGCETFQHLYCVEQRSD